MLFQAQHQQGGCHHCNLTGWTQGSSRVHPAPHQQTAQPTYHSQHCEVFPPRPPHGAPARPVGAQWHPSPHRCLLGDVLICLHLPNHMADTFITTNLQFPGITLRLVNTNGGRGTTPKGGFEIPTLEQRETMVLPSVGSRLDTILPSHSQLLQSLPKHALAGCMCTPMTLGERTELTSAPLNPRGPFTLRLISGKP